MDSPVIGASALSMPPYLVLGYRADGRPIYPIAGGSGEDDDTTDVEVEDDTSEAEPDDSPEEEEEEEQPKAEEKPKPAPPKPAEDPEIGKLRYALKKANEEARLHRQKLKEREAKDRENEGEQERALREAAESAEKKWGPRIINSAARASLAEAGVTGSPDRLLRLLDMDAMSIDDDGDVIGLDTEIDRLRTDYPEFFEKPVEAPRPKARPTAAPKPAAPAVPKNSWDKHAARLRGI